MLACPSQIGRDFGFETVTPFKSFDVFITAEQDSRATGPSGPEVLKATIQP